MNGMKKLLCGLCIGVISVVSFRPVEVVATEIEVTEDATDESKTSEEEEAIETHPQLIIESYEIATGTFERSAECVFRVHVENIDTENAAEMGSIAMYSSYVYPVFGKTNQITFGKVNPGEIVSVDFEVNLDRIINGPNPIEFVLCWSDKESIVYTNSIQVSPVLLEKVGFEVSTVRIPETVYGSKNTTLSISYENTGAENLQNVYMILDGDIAQGIQVVELDDISAKRKDMVEYSLELLNMGENHILVSFKYEDRNGTEYITETIEHVVTVTEENYIFIEPPKMDVREILEEYRVFVAGAALAVLLCIPFLIGLIRRGGKKR